MPTINNSGRYSTETTYTLNDFIKSGKMTTVDYDNFSYKDLVSNGTEVSILNVVNDYMREIKEQAVTVKLSTEEYLKYRYKPKLLCRDVYGNGELYYVIMLLNGRIDVKDFDRDTLLMLRVESMNTLLTQIYNAEYKWMNEYNTEHGT